MRRNSKRFPEDFKCQLTKEEADVLLLQIARAKTGGGGRQTPPYAFTEHGVAMLSSVLKSESCRSKLEPQTSLPPLLSGFRLKYTAGSGNFKSYSSSPEERPSRNPGIHHSNDTRCFQVPRAITS